MLPTDTLLEGDQSMRRLEVFQLAAIIDTGKYWYPIERHF